MLRRTFLSALAAISLLFREANQKPRDESNQGYMFDWTSDPPITNDPAYTQKLKYGKHNHVYCDDIEIQRVIRFFTGPQGWVERYSTDTDDRLLSCGDRLVTERVTGVVKYIDSRRVS